MVEACIGVSRVWGGVLIRRQPVLSVTSWRAVWYH
jgi:hypothetical protein